jgi:hypothetical protein
MENFTYEKVPLGSLQPPPENVARTLALETVFLLGDLQSIGVEAAIAYIASHPIVVTKVKKHGHVVVGQFRSWELAECLVEKFPEFAKAVPILSTPGTLLEAEGRAADNLLLEATLGTLAPEYAGAQISRRWMGLSNAAQNRMLPAAATQQKFSDLLGYESRSGFDVRRRNPNSKLEVKSEARHDSPSLEQDNS